MTLGTLITQLLRPCSSAPKSPTPPDSPNAEQPKADPIGISEVTACTDISNAVSTGSPPAIDKAAAVTSGTNSSNCASKDTENRSGAAPQEPSTRPVTITDATQDDSDKLILDAFGFDVLHQLQGKSWDERTQAVQSVRAKVVQGALGSVSVDAFFHAGCCVAVVALKDKVMPVFFDGLDLAKVLLGDFAEKHELAKETLSAEVDNVIPIIVAKTSDRNARSIEGTRQAIVFLARHSTVGSQQVFAHILTPINNAKEVAAIRGRLELIGHIIEEFGLSKASSLSLSTVMAFVRPHLDATDEKVRRAAVEVTVSCYTLKGDRTMKYCANLKPALLKLLEQRFAEVDGCKNVKKSSTNGNALPEVRGTKSRKSGNAGSRDSNRNSNSSGSMGSHSKPLAPLDMRPGQGPALDDKLTHADIFAPVYNDVLRSPGVHESPFLSSPSHEQPKYGTAIDPNGHSTLAMHEDPNYIPSPTAPDHDPFDEQALMDEIEGIM